VEEPAHSAAIRRPGLARVPQKRARAAVRGAKKWSNEPVQPRFGGQNLRVFVKVAIRDGNPCRTQDVFCRSSSEKAIPAEEALTDPGLAHRSIFRLP